MLKIDLKIENCINEEKLKDLIGEEGMWKIFYDLEKHQDKCSGCDFQKKPHQKLKLHILKINEDNPIDSQAVLLCRACYYLKHFEKAVEKDCVKLTNSIYSQVELIQKQRTGISGGTNQRIRDKKIVPINYSPKDYLEKIKSDPLKYDPYIKILFWNNFDWTKCM